MSVDNRPPYKWTIYLVTNKENKKIYIGMTRRSVEERFATHLENAKRGYSTYFYNALRKYGAAAFISRRIDSTENEQEARLLEQLYIGIFMSYRSAIGYNGTLGGTGGVPTEETRKKISLSRRGKLHSEEAKRRISEALRGRTKSPEWRHKIGLANIGKHFGPQTEEWRQKISKATHYGKPCSEETKLKIGLANRGKIPWNRGIPRTEETKQKLRDAMTGKHHSEETKQKIREALRVRCTQH